MFNFFKKPNKINKEDLKKYFEIANIIVFKYLCLWFKEIFKLQPYLSIEKDHPGFHETLATEVMRLLLAYDDNRSSETISNETILLAKMHAPKWADDVMEQDKDLCELVIKTLTVDLIMNCLSKGDVWLTQDPIGIKVTGILTKYGVKLPVSYTPQEYIELVNKWMIWDKIAHEKEKDNN